MKDRAKAIREKLGLTSEQEKTLVSSIKKKSMREDISRFNVAYYVYFVTCMSIYSVTFDEIIKRLES